MAPRRAAASKDDASKEVVSKVDCTPISKGRTTRAAAKAAAVAIAASEATHTAVPVEPQAKPKPAPAKSAPKARPAKAAVIPKVETASKVTKAKAAPKQTKAKASNASTSKSSTSKTTHAIPSAANSNSTLSEYVLAPNHAVSSTASTSFAPPLSIPIRPKAITNPVEALYYQYANDENDIQNEVRDKIGPNGVGRLLDDLHIEATDRKTLILVFQMKPEHDCEFTWPEWETGMRKMGVKSIAGLRNKLNSLDDELQDPKNFKALYNFTFDYAKKPGQRNLDLELAISFWDILFKEEFPLYPTWREYMNTEHKKPVTKDTWMLLAEFLYDIKSDLSNFDEEDSCWPSVMDTFVAWARKKMNKATDENA